MRVLIAILFTAMAASAQEAAPAKQSPPPQVSKLIEVKNVNPDRIVEVLRNFTVDARADNTMHVISVRGSKESVAAYEEAVRKLDTQQPAEPNIETTVYLLVADSQPQQAQEPAELSGVVRQLRGLFAYKSYRLLDTFVVRGRDRREGTLAGFAAVAETKPRMAYLFRYAEVAIGPASAGRTIRYRNLQFRIGVPSEGQTDIGTDVDVREGQKAVVGKSTLANGSDAIILVISPKIVE